jgi:hypothetical protein
MLGKKIFIFLKSFDFWDYEKEPPSKANIKEHILSENQSQLSVTAYLIKLRER